MKRDDLINNANGGLDRNQLEDALDSIIENFHFVIEWGGYRETRIHLHQEDGEIVHYLVNECDQNPRWLKPSLSWVPNDVWLQYDITP